MKIKGEWEGIPGFWLDDPQSPDGRRWIATHHGWSLIQKRVREMASMRCEVNATENCLGRDVYLDVHHRRGRGGGKRDDRITILGKRNLLGVCRPCHAVVKIERKEEIWPESHHNKELATA